MKMEQTPMVLVQRYPLYSLASFSIPVFERAALFQKFRKEGSE
jgi:hypothetical protein